jgi:hypothetical protein
MKNFAINNNLLAKQNHTLKGPSIRGLDLLADELEFFVIPTYSTEP